MILEQYKFFSKLIRTTRWLGAKIAKVIRMHEANLIICSAAVFLCVYLTAVSVLRLPLLHPFVNKYANITNVDTVDHAQSAISVVIIWIAALVIGRISTYVRLPSLLGVLLCGVALRNIPFTAEYLSIDKGMNNFLRKSAFAVILIRGGIGLDWLALKKTKGVIFRFGVLSSIFEACVIALLAYLIFGMGAGMSFIFGMTLAATSPAVTIPTMLGLSKKGYGNDSGVTTAILAAAAIDNMICITLDNVFLSFLTAHDSIELSITCLVIQIIVGIILGFGVGFLLWILPRKQSRQVHFTRVTLLFWICMTFIFGAQAIAWDSGGVIATILTSFICSVKWKEDTPQKAEKESEAFALMWNLVGMQMMFATIGFDFDFSVLHLEVVLKGFAILVVALVMRIIFVFLMSYGGNFKRSEQIFLSLCFFPKATVQAALVPQVVSAFLGTPCEHQALVIMTTSVFAIIITAPVGQFILQLLGPHTLGPKRTASNVAAIQVLGLDEYRDDDQSNSNT